MKTEDSPRSDGLLEASRPSSLMAAYRVALRTGMQGTWLDLD